MHSQKLFTKGEIFQDEFLTGTQSPDSPADEVPERREHGRKSYRNPDNKTGSNSLILRVHDLLMGHKEASLFLALASRIRPSVQRAI